LRMGHRARVAGDDQVHCPRFRFGGAPLFLQDLADGSILTGSRYAGSLAEGVPMASIADHRETREPAATGAADLSGQKGPELCVVVPTFNERDNVDLVVGRLDRTLRRIAWERALVDDDARDGPAEHIRAL